MTIDSVARAAAESPDAYWAEHYGRTVILGLISNSLTPEKAGSLARMAGSYGRRALAHQECVQLVFGTLKVMPEPEDSVVRR